MPYASPRCLVRRLGALKAISVTLNACVTIKASYLRRKGYRLHSHDLCVARYSNQTLRGSAATCSAGPPVLCGDGSDVFAEIRSPWTNTGRYPRGSYLWLATSTKALV